MGQEGEARAFSRGAADPRDGQAGPPEAPAGTPAASAIPSGTDAVPPVPLVPIPAEVINPIERVALWVVVVGLLAIVGVVVERATVQDLAEYDKTFQFVEAQKTCLEDYMMLRVALTPFRSLVFVRSAALFLSFNLVLLGCLFVVAGLRAAYQVSVEAKGTKSTLDTASPGLVLVTVGALLMGASLYRTGSPTFTPVPCSPPGDSAARVLNPPITPGK